MSIRQLIIAPWFRIGIVVMAGLMVSGTFVAGYQVLLVDRQPVVVDKQLPTIPPAPANPPALTSPSSTQPEPKPGLTPPAEPTTKPQKISASQSPTANSPLPSLVESTPADNQPEPQPEPIKKTYPAVKVTGWGISLSPFPYYAENQTALEESVRLAADLGVTIIRLDYPVNWSYLEPWQPILVDTIRARGIDVVVSFQPPKTYETDNPWQDGFDLGKKVARQFGGKVSYQIGNEICGNAIKPGWPGTNKESFYDDKLEKVRAWVKGASTAVAQSAPGAMQSTTGHWLHFWCINEILNGDGGIPNIKILGWDWFNDGNRDLTAVKSGDETINLVEKLQEIGRELWIMESGNERGGNAGEDYQADYLEKFSAHIVGTKAFRAFFYFYVHDDVTKLGQDDGSRGLIRINKNEFGHYSLGGLKPAYDRYKQVIVKYK